MRALINLLKKLPYRMVNLPKKIAIQIKFQIDRKKLKNTDFTIISNNCWGGFLYQELGLEYRSPFVGLFLFGPCYLNLLENFKENMNSELIFINRCESKYLEEINNTEGLGLKYPIGRIGKNIEIHFLHYKTEQEAYEKWNRRKKRVNMENILIKYCEKQFGRKDLVERFIQLPFRNKLCFTIENTGVLGTIYYPELKNKYDYEIWSYKKYVDIITYLNNLNRGN